MCGDKALDIEDCGLDMSESIWLRFGTAPEKHYRDEDYAEQATVAYLVNARRIYIGKHAFETSICFSCLIKRIQEHAIMWMQW